MKITPNNRILVLLFVILFTNTLYSVPASPKPQKIIQPDGTILTVYLRGDEHAHYRTTEDDYLIKKDTDGFYKLGILNNNEIVTSRIIARNISDRTAEEKTYLQKVNKASEIQALRNRALTRSISKSPQHLPANFPKTGSPKSLVILVNFKDVKFKIPNPQPAITKLLNEENYSDNGATGSARDYFIASSGGKFSPEFEVVGPYDLPNNMKYYGENDSHGDDMRPVYMLVDACKAADADVDFSEYDTNNDGKIDNVFIYYAGYNEAEYGGDDTVWPHRWNVELGWNANYNGDRADLIFDGKEVYDYACSSELAGNSGTNMCAIGTFAHEFGHVIGMVDYYKTDGSFGKTIEDWSIMDHGSYNNDSKTPPVYSAYDRFYLGWSTPTEITAPDSFILDPINQTNIDVTERQSYLIANTTHNMDGANPNPNEFFIVEYRKKTGWDAYLPDEGMLIWHIDYNKWAWDNNSPNNYTGVFQSSNSHMRVYIQPLVGDTANTGTTFKSGSYTPVLWNKDTLSTNGIKKTISNIIMNDNNTMSFDFMGGVKASTDNTNRKLFVERKQNELIVNKQDVNEPIYVYDVSGKMIYTNNDSKISITLPTGILKENNIYLLKSGRESIKIIY